MKKWGVLATVMLYSMVSVLSQVKVRIKVVSLQSRQPLKEATNRAGRSLTGCTTDADIYRSFMSRTGVSRIGAAIGKCFAQSGLWLKNSLSNLPVLLPPMKLSIYGG